jgi:hypothetical protein
MIACATCLPAEITVIHRRVERLEELGASNAGLTLAKFMVCH